MPADVTEAVKKERERFAGFQPDPANTEFGKYMQEEAARWLMVIDKAGIKGE